eukprot:SAG22_NODE_150_length_17426_cov_8.082588_2_plen_62_part_00
MAVVELVHDDIGPGIPAVALLLLLLLRLDLGDEGLEVCRRQAGGSHTSRRRRASGGRDMAM